MPQPGLLQWEALPFVLFELLLICGINECLIHSPNHLLWSRELPLVVMFMKNQRRVACVKNFQRTAYNYTRLVKKVKRQPIYPSEFDGVGVVVVVVVSGSFAVAAVVVTVFVSVFSPKTL